MTDEHRDPQEVAVKQVAPWPPNWARSVAFMVGLGLMVWETVIDQAAHLVVYGPAFLLTGLPIARGVETILDRLPWGQPTKPPSEGK